MSRYATKSGFVEISFELKAYETKTVDFLDVQPNYYRVQNMGTSKLYCGVSKMPTTEDYDFVVKPEGLKLYAEPFKRGFLYLYNPSGSPTRGKIVAFAAEFDPLSLALSDIEIDMSDIALTTVTAIDEFRAPLPAGTNNIGKMQVSNFPTDYAKAANQHNYTTTISNILDKISGVLNSCRKYARSKSGNASTAGTTYNAVGTICEIAFCSNDGVSDITLTLTESNGTENSVVIKGGEVLNNIPCSLSSIKVAGNAVAFRLVYCEIN